MVPRARFNYETRTWATREYYLPELNDDYVLLTPMNMLTREDTWINHSDMVSKLAILPEAIPNEQLRAQINEYLREKLGQDPSAEQRAKAAQETIRRFPELIDRYIRLQEDQGGRAETISAGQVEETREALIEQVETLVTALEETEFYAKPWTSYEESLSRVKYFKGVIEDNDGYKLFQRDDGFACEADLQRAFFLVWCNTEFDVQSEAQQRPGTRRLQGQLRRWRQVLDRVQARPQPPAKRNLEKQVEIYKKANRTDKAVKVIINFTAKDEARVEKVLKELGRENEESILVIDARSDNKPSASKA